ATSRSIWGENARRRHGPRRRSATRNRRTSPPNRSAAGSSRPSSTSSSISAKRPCRPADGRATAATARLPGRAASARGATRGPSRRCENGRDESSPAPPAAGLDGLLDLFQHLRLLLLILAESLGQVGKVFERRMQFRELHFFVLRWPGFLFESPVLL